MKTTAKLGSAIDKDEQAMKITSQQRGFTLIEIVIAIGVTVILGAIAAVSIDRSVQMREELNAALQQLNEVESFWQLLETDINHATNRRLPSAAVRLGETRESAFLGGDPETAGSSYLLGANFLLFARDGWPNPLQQPRSDLQRVGYRFNEGRVWRDYWAERNQALDEPPIGTRLLMQSIEAIEVRFLPGNADKVVGGPWQNVWPPTDQQYQQQGPWLLPAAIEVTLRTEALGDVQRIFVLPGA